MYEAVQYNHQLQPYRFYSQIPTAHLNMAHYLRLKDEPGEIETTPTWR